MKRMTRDGRRFLATWLATGLFAACLCSAADAGAPRVLLYHSFDDALDRPDLTAAPVSVDVTDAVAHGEQGVYGRFALFPRGAAGATVRLNMEEPAPAEAWTIAFFQCIQSKEVLNAPDLDLLKVLDQRGNALLTVNKSGRVRVLASGGDTQAEFECFDALYWIDNEDIHLAVTYDADGAGGGNPAGRLMMYWEARPYGCLYTDLGDRRPAAIVLGGDDAASGVDELAVFDAALPLRAIYALSRPPRIPPDAVSARMAASCAEAAVRPFAARGNAWRRLARAGRVVEAESGSDGSVESGPKAASASGRAFVRSGGEPAVLTFDVTEPGDYVLALRYAVGRSVDLQWPVRHPEAKTAWSHNAAAIGVSLDGQEPVRELLYPTGVYDNGHRGDVDPWAWHALREGRPVRLEPGRHTLRLTPAAGSQHPLYDALLACAEAGPRPPHPRWVDAYRIPPAWWVADHRVEVREGRRTDTYAVALRNRCDEPYAAAIALEHDMLGEGQSAEIDAERIELAPHEEKLVRVTFETPADTPGSSGYLRVVLWNEDVDLPMEYRLWNYTPEQGFAEREHPVLIPPPDPEMQRAFRAWLEERDRRKLTPELRKWAAGPDLDAAAPEYKALAQGAKVRLKMFREPLLGEQLDMLDMWMNMTATQADLYLSDASAEDHGYGSTWDKVNNALTGVWHGHSRVLSLEPEMDLVSPGGDLDVVTRFTAEGYDYETWRKSKEKVFKTAAWEREQDPDVFMALRMIRWAVLVSEGNLGLRTEYPRNAGLPMLAEAYYLTGDQRYAHKAVELARVYARKYTLNTKQFFAGLHREDRDWWGTRLGGRYMSQVGTGIHQILGTHLLDLCWDALSEKQRDMLIHNLVRWGMYEATYGPLWDDPDKGTKVNREDMPPFIAFGRIVGDPAPRRGLQDYFRLVNKMVLPDGIHICSTGSYGGVGTYVSFMQKFASLGLDVTADNPSLRNAFLNHPRFVFACGALQPIDDGGGGQNLLQLGALFGSPNDKQYEWAYEQCGDELMPAMRNFIKGVYASCTRPRPPARAEAMRAFYAGGEFPIDELWPPLFVAEHKGMAMLRNRAPEDPLDWIEVIFDYGKFGGRFHGHPCKLSILTAFNGQVGSQDYGDLTRNSKDNNNAWFKGGYSHNTVQVDYRGHRGAGGPAQIGELIDAGGDADVQWIDAKSDRMFDGVHMRRTTFVTDAGIVDFTLCRSGREHVYDWPYHNYGIAETVIPLSETDLSDQGLLRFAEDARSGTVDGTVQVTWKDTPLSDPPHKGQTSLIGEDVFCRLWALPQSGTELVLFAGPTVTTVNEEKQIDYAMLRRKAGGTVFAVLIEPWRASTGPKIAGMEKLQVLGDNGPVADVEAYAVKVSQTDGTVRVFAVNYGETARTAGERPLQPGATWWRVD